MSDTRSLMILGAGIYQLPLIRAAKHMGLHTIVVSIPGPYPGFAEADEICYLDTRDEEGILKEARLHQVSGILTTGTDVAMRSIGRTCDELGLSGISYAAAQRLTDKARMKTAFKSAGVSSSDFYIVYNEAEALEAANKLGYPVMIKATDSSGSRGISRIDLAADVLRGFSYAQAASHANHFIVEKFARGTEIGLDAFVWDGQLKLCLPHTKHVYKTDKVTIPIGHSFPYPCSDTLNKKLRAEIEKLIRASGANNCALNADIFVDGNEQISVIEAGGRCGATTIPELITHSTGVSYYQEMIRAALGEEPHMDVFAMVPWTGMLICAPKNARVTAIDDAAIAALQSDELDISLDIKPGDTISVMRDGTDRIGQIIAKTDSVPLMHQHIDQILRYIQLSEL